eukprot:GHVR01103348.1.p1 GENE.GHVR01103348.1~~GHVR01103348.1.p1  ORF type:complete len:217 (+),score=44.06 GHVR01103348.1:570-1220(+)
MDWISRWQNGFIGWHEQQANLRLKKFIKNLNIKKGDVVFVPLCGKSLDMLFLLEQGFKVIGVELSELAVEGFFKENNIVFVKTELTDFSLYQADDIKIYCGDIFKLTNKMLEEISAIYDRASLIALDKPLRQKYVKHLLGIIPSCVEWLLLTMNYPQQQKDGPPFAVDKDEVEELFHHPTYSCLQLELINDLNNEQKFIEAKVDFLEKAVYLLRKN